ncbi:hypothetical protein [Erysipelothrix inopinata]|uniref:hypothetical protein n=1 Tax=Erysipelothrix inopinata TaxID=225084 RepID=UPI001FEAE927|nr:hypothetical protein [Erysipelothrix inopinata]
MEKMSIKEFINKILAGAAMGIVVGLIPNAIFGEIFKALGVSVQFLLLWGTLQVQFNLQYLYLWGCLLL